MVDAGRILIMPKGIWSNLVSYEMLDVVTQDNIAYLARQSSVGVSPKNDSSYTYWQPFGTSVTPDGETIIMNSAGNITANIDNKSLIYDAVNMYVKVAIDGSTIKYDNSNGYLYVDASNFNINDLNNISITSPANGQVLVYDSTTQKWKNGQGSVSPIDNLTSNSTTQPLSANQGRVLNNQKLEKEIISDAWNASTTYAVGKYCIYNNSLWKCLVQNNGQTPTEGTYWTKVNVANEITSVNNSLVATDGQKLYFDSKDGKYGYNTDPSRGADTFVPFKSGGLIEATLPLSLVDMTLSARNIHTITYRIDLTDVKTITFSAKGGTSGNYNLTYGICEDVPTDTSQFKNSNTVGINNNAKTITLDVSAYSGYHYLCFYYYIAGGNYYAYINNIVFS